MELPDKVAGNTSLDTNLFTNDYPDMPSLYIYLIEAGPYVAEMQVEESSG